MAGEPAGDCKRHVLAHALRQQESLVLPVLGDEREPDPGVQRLPRAADAHVAPVDLDPPLGAQDAEEREEELELPLALEPSDSEHLARVHVEVDVAQAMPEPKPADAERDRVADALPLLGVEPLDPPAQHHRDDLVLGRIGRRPRADHRAVAKDRDLVGDLLHLAEAVRDVDDDHPRLGEAPSQSEEPLHLARRERRCRLVENEHAGLGRHRLGDLDELALGDRKPAHLATRVDRRKREPFEEALRLADERPTADGSQRRQRLAAEPDVLRNGQVGDERELLEDRRDTARAPRRAGCRERAACRTASTTRRRARRRR